MTPISFICALKEAGLNIFPSEHSHFYVVINYKVRTSLSKFNVKDIQNGSQYSMLCNSSGMAQVFCIHSHRTDWKE